jgi:hypothetical protein
MLNANRAGSSLGATFAAFYSLCSLVFVVWPQGFMAAISMLFHGFELSSAPHALTIGWFIAGLLCIAFWGYLIGAVYTLIWNALGKT